MKVTAKAILPGVVWKDEAYADAASAELLNVLTEWNEFLALDPGRLALAKK